ncbi:MAG TPA: HIT domain-containing protein [Blastocatellia bacterium]|nr:HIT domain-containing protein [Blastocatellia bacterium]
MEHIWSPWRYKYIASVDREPGCVFCAAEAGPDDEYLILHRATLSFIILNLYPYTSGHLMIVPYEHVASLSALKEATTTQMMELAKLSQRALETEYKPDGFNIGINLGRSAGAGVAEHVHMHVVPRWTGDANFVSVVGETRVLPEELATTYERLRKHFYAR